MKNRENKNGLKGQYNLAQGKRSRESGSVALGLGIENEIVRAIRFIEEEFFFRTKRNISFPLHIVSIPSVRKRLFDLLNIFARTVFILHSIPRVPFRIVPPETLPWARIGWPSRLALMPTMK